METKKPTGIIGGKEAALNGENKPGRAFMRKVMPAALIIVIVIFILARFTEVGRVIGGFWDIVKPVFFGMGLAFLMNPIMRFFEKLLLRLCPQGKAGCTEKKKAWYRRFARVVSTILALLVIVAMVAGFLVAVVPQFVEAVQYLSDNLYDKIVGVLDWADELTNYRFADTMERARTDGRINVWIDTAEKWVMDYFHLGEEDNVIHTVTEMGRQVGRSLVNGVVALFIAVYLLISKESYKGHIKRLIYGTFRRDIAELTLDVVRKAHDIFYGFIIGKIMDSIIIGMICFVSMLIMGLPYALICSFIVGVTNIIPVFGPYIGAVPTVILLFVNQPGQGILFLIYIIILQQVDGNLIGPKILGDSTGVSPFWVIVAIVVGGGLFGFFGMLLGVPTVAVLLYLLDRLMEHRTRQKGLPTEAEEYIHFH